MLYLREDKGAGRMDDTDREAFSVFFADAEPRLRRALIALINPDVAAALSRVNVMSGQTGTSVVPAGS